MAYSSTLDTKKAQEIHSLLGVNKTAKRGQIPQKNRKN